MDSVAYTQYHDDYRVMSDLFRQVFLNLHIGSYVVKFQKGKKWEKLTLEDIAKYRLNSALQEVEKKRKLTENEIYVLFFNSIKYNNSD